MNLDQELRDFEYRQIDLSPKDILPKFDLDEFRKIIGPDLKGVKRNPHLVVLDTTLKLWMEGYDQIIDKFGFWEKGFDQFSGHCHQISPVLGLALLVKGFDEITYREGYRMDLLTGNKFDPNLEPNPQMREEFCGIGRIPYCHTGVVIGDKEYIFSGKHLKSESGRAQPLLTPVCYQQMEGVFIHPFDITKSGIYLEKKFEGDKILSPNREIIWMKQKVNQDGSAAEPAEFFKTFLDIRLRL